MGRSPSRRQLLGAAAVLSVGPWAPTSGAASPAVLRFGVSTAGVGSPPRVGTGWLSVAQTRRYVEEALAPSGVKVEWVFFKGQGPATNEALSNDQLDFTTLGDLPATIGRSVGIRTRLVLNTNTRLNAYVAVPPGSRARSVPELKGLRVAYHKGTATQLAANRIFEQHGLTERDLKVINLEPASMLAAFASGDVDALVGSLTLVSLAEKGKARVVHDTRQQPQLTGSGHVLVRDAFATAQPALTQQVVTALVRAAHWASLDANRAEVMQLWASSGSISAATYEGEFRGIPLVQRLSPRLDDFALAGITRARDDALRYRLIRKPFDVGQWVDRSFSERALAELKLTDFWPRFDAQGLPAAA